VSADRAPVRSGPPPGVPAGTAFADPPTAAALRLGAGPAGVVLGTADGAPVPVPLFRSGSVAVLLVGGLPLAQVVALRTFATGARVDVLSARPDAWESVTRLATGGVEGLSVRSPGPAEPGSPARPRLVVVDEEGSPAGPRTAAPWTCVLTVVERLTARQADALGAVDLVLARPLSAPEARIAAAALANPAAERALAAVPAGMLGLAGRSRSRVLAPAQTSVERWLVGPLDGSRPGSPPTGAPPTAAVSPPSPRW
jgi:hypothetical protein